MRIFAHQYSSWRIFAIHAALLIGICLSFPAYAAPKKSDDPNSAQYLLSALQIQNDDPNGIVTATGNVEIHNDRKILKADSVEYNQKQNTVSADGNVTMITEDSNVVFAKQTTMSSDFANGSAKNVAMLMTDNSRFVAVDARRLDNRYMLFGMGMFSPCNLCTTNPRKAPIWQIKAAKVTHDAVEKNLIYRDAVMEFWGVPIFYTPYMSHPDPTVKRRQGLLNASYSFKPDIKNNITLPYYFDIAPDMDYTFRPTFSQTDGMRFAGTVRKRYEHGDIKVDHSLVIADRLDDDNVTKHDQIRGHLTGYAHFDIDNVFRTGADFSVLSDKSYLQRYGEAQEDVLTNRVFLEGFKARNFGAVEMYYFQDNRPGGRPEQAMVLPRFRTSFIGEPNMTLGGRWSFDGELTALKRDTGQDTRKLGTEFGWQRREILPYGFVTNLKGSVRNDTFWVDNLPSAVSPGTTFNNDVTNRLFPQGQVMVSYPIAGYAETFTHTLEPIVTFNASPTRKLDPRIPNEDSLDVDFDTSNLFELSRYPGTDSVEQGLRTAYGFKTGFYNHGGGYSEATFGQSYRFTQDPLFSLGSGLDTPFSDYVGQVKLEPGDWMYLIYNFRLDKDKLKSHRHEVYTSFGVPEFRPYVTFTYSDPDNFIPGVSNRVEELKPGFTTTVADYYTFNFEQNYTLRPDTQGLLSTKLSLAYRDECFTSSLSFTRDHTVRTGVKSGDTFLFRIYFKSLGGIDG